MELSIQRKIEDTSLQAIAVLHSYQATITHQPNPKFGGKGELAFIDIPNPESDIDFALRFLTEKIDSVIVHEVSFPIIQAGNILIKDVEKLKVDTETAIKGEVIKPLK